MKMTKRGLPSSSTLGSCGARRCCSICRSDQLLPPRASTTSARLAVAGCLRGAALRTRRPATSTDDSCPMRAGPCADGGLSDTPPTTSMYVATLPGAARHSTEQEKIKQAYLLVVRS